MTERGKRVEAILSRAVTTIAAESPAKPPGAEAQGTEIRALATRPTSPPLTSLRVFDVIGRLGSIRKAALALGVDHAGVSRHLRDLESWAGMALMDRRRGELGGLTPEGMRYHARIAAALIEIENAGADLLKRKNTCQIEVSCAHGLCRWLIRHLHQFSVDHPDIELSLRPLDSYAEVSRAAVSAEIRLVPDWERRSMREDMHTVELVRPIMIPVASPKFLATMPRPAELKDLMAWPVILERDEKPWQIWLANMGLRVVGPAKVIKLWNAPLILEAVKRGQGFTLGHHFTVEDDLESGELIEVLVGGKRCPRVNLGSYVLEAREDQWLNPALATFRSWLKNTMRLSMDGSSISDV